MSQKGRDAYRAIYLSSRLRFCTSLHAFSPVLPTYFVDPWQKDHFAVHRHKWRATKKRRWGRWSYTEGPLAGVRLEGWPDPGLASASGLAPVAARAQAEGLAAPEFWWQLAERLRKVRDVVRAGDLATILDALVTADQRHTDLLRTLTRELVDDADKLSFVELAVVANAYAHFRCFSAPLLGALAGQAEQLLAGQEALESDPRSLPVLVKAFARLGFRNEDFLQAANLATVSLAGRLPFADLADTLTAFVTLGQPFQAPPSFWAAAAASVPGSRMASLCPALRAVALLKVPQMQRGSAGKQTEQQQQQQQPPMQLREALVAEIAAGLQATLADAAAVPFGGALGAAGVARRLPAFAVTPMPQSLLAPGELPLLPTPRSLDAGASTWGETEPAAEWSLGGDSRFDLVEEGPPSPRGGTGGARFIGLGGEAAGGGSPLLAPLETGDGGLGPETAEGVRGAAAAAAAPPPRWYNAVARAPFAAASAERAAPYDASATFSRNRRGQLVADALEGLGVLWRQDIEGCPSGQPPGGNGGGGGGGSPAPLDGAASLQVAPAEAELLQAAAPVLSSAVQGLGAAQLAACAETYAMFHASERPPGQAAAPGPVLDAVRDVVQEAFRKLSNFSVPELRRLHAASQRVGLDDAYLERARRRRFPRALRAELRGGGQQQRPPPQQQ